MEQRSTGQEEDSKGRSWTIHASEHRFKSERIDQYCGRSHHQTHTETLHPSTPLVRELDNITADADVRDSSHQNVNVIGDKHHVTDFIAEVNGRSLHPQIESRQGECRKGDPADGEMRSFESIRFALRRLFP